MRWTARSRRAASEIETTRMQRGANQMFWAQAACRISPDASTRRPRVRTAASPNSSKRSSTKPSAATKTVNGASSAKGKSTGARPNLSILLTCISYSSRIADGKPQFLRRTARKNYKTPLRRGVIAKRGPSPYTSFLYLGQSAYAPLSLPSARPPDPLPEETAPPIRVFEGCQYGT